MRSGEVKLAPHGVVAGVKWNVCMWRVRHQPTPKPCSLAGAFRAFRAFNRAVGRLETQTTRNTSSHIGYTMVVPVVPTMALKTNKSFPYQKGAWDWRHLPFRCGARLGTGERNKPRCRRSPRRQGEDFSKKRRPKHPGHAASRWKQTSCPWTPGVHSTSTARAEGTARRGSRAVVPPSSSSASARPTRCRRRSTRQPRWRQRTPRFGRSEGAENPTM